MVDVIINRDQWGRGEIAREYGSSLRFYVDDEKKNRYCCAGIMAKQLTGDDEKLHGLGYIKDYERRYPGKVQWPSSEWTRDNQTPDQVEGNYRLTIVGSLYAVNDDNEMDDTERELILGHLGEMLGVNFIFV